jgi:hypothetical protein
VVITILHQLLLYLVYYLIIFFYLKTSLIYFPDILRKFNSGITGYSTGNGNQNSAGSRFNVAVTGAVSS